MSERYAVTHNGKFHADDVFAAAVLRKVDPELPVVRTRDQMTIDRSWMVFDVGGVYDHENRRYDHHQVGAMKRDNGLTCSAFGLLWLHYGNQYCDGNERVAEIIDQDLVIGIDAPDNGEVTGGPSVPDFGISNVIELLNPLSGSDETYDMQFETAVEMANGILSRLEERARADVAVEDDIKALLNQGDDNRYIILDHQINPPERLSHIESLEYIVFPETINHTWQVYAIKRPDNPFMSKRPLPEGWAGLRESELASVSGVPDAVFCHLKRFLAVAKSREGALALLLSALSS